MKTRAFDLLERVLVALFYVFLVTRILGALRRGEGPAGNVLLLVSEGMVLVFVLVRRPSERISLRPSEWLLALAATCGPMLLGPATREHAAVHAGSVLMVFGLLVQVHAKWSLGRSVGCVPAHRGLVTDGPYRFVRHPMYAGYVLSDLGFVLMNPTAWNAGVYVTCLALQIPRLLAEERLLGADAAYVRYREDVRWRLVPGLF